MTFIWGTAKPRPVRGCRLCRLPTQLYLAAQSSGTRFLSSTYYHLSSHVPIRHKLTAADTKLDATFVNSNTQTAETVHITGKWPGDIVEMFWRGHLVGLILRQFTRRDILGQNTVSRVVPNSTVPGTSRLRVTRPRTKAHAQG